MAKLNSQREVEVDAKFDEMLDDGKSIEDYEKWCDEQPDADEITTYYAEMITPFVGKPVKTGKKK